VNTTLLIVGVVFGAAILVAALKAALGPDNKQHGQSDGGSGIGISYNHHSKHDDDDGDGDSGGDGD
jgi:hypothetical protein